MYIKNSSTQEIIQCYCPKTEHYQDPFSKSKLETSIEWVIENMTNVNESETILRILQKHYLNRKHIKRIIDKANQFYSWTFMCSKEKASSAKKEALLEIIKILIVLSENYDIPINKEIKDIPLIPLSKKTHTFQEWTQIYAHSSTESPLEDYALKKMYETHQCNQSLRLENQWKIFKIAYCTPINSDLHLLASKCLNKKQIIFWDWRKLYYIANSNHLKEIILKKMISLAKDFWEWHSLYNISQNKQINKTAIEKMQELANTKEEKEIIQHMT